MRCNFRWLLLQGKLFSKDTAAATSIEYALIASGLSIAILVVVFTIGGDVANLLSGVNLTGGP